MKYIIQIDDTSTLAKSILSVIKNIAKTSNKISVKSKVTLEKEYDDWFVEECEKAKKSGVVNTVDFLNSLGK